MDESLWPCVCLCRGLAASSLAEVRYEEGEEIAWVLGLVAQASNLHLSLSASFSLFLSVSTSTRGWNSVRGYERGWHPAVWRGTPNSAVRSSPKSSLSFLRSPACLYLSLRRATSGNSATFTTSKLSRNRGFKVFHATLRPFFPQLATISLAFFYLLLFRQVVRHILLKYRLSD